MANNPNRAVSRRLAYQRLVHRLHCSRYQSLAERRKPGYPVDIVNFINTDDFSHRLPAVGKAHEFINLNRERFKKGFSLENLERSPFAVMNGTSHSRKLDSQVMEEELPSVKAPNTVQEHLPFLRLSNVHHSTHKKTKEETSNLHLPDSSYPSDEITSQIHAAKQYDCPTPLPNDNVSSSHQHVSHFPSALNTCESSVKHIRKHPLHLPPILLPRVYTLTPRPMQFREFLIPTKVRGPLSDEEWEDLKECRYIRQSLPRFAAHLRTSDMSSLKYS